MAKRLTQEEFIRRAQDKHDKKYKYTLVNYKNNSTEVKIICLQHGVFKQRPNVHLKGAGCPECAGTKKLTTKKFIERAKQTHKNFYDYSLVEYKNNSTKVKIICPEHGVFEQRAGDHLQKHGCPECAKVIRNTKESLTQKEFISRAKSKHNNYYNYNLINYKNNNTKIKIICPEHGVFEQTPSAHLRGQGCPCCSGNKKKNTRGFIKEAKKVHPEYDYSLVKYNGSKKKIKIICPEHGVFEQIPNDHLQGAGCPECAKTGFNPNKPAYLYYLYDPISNLFKIGITNLSIQKRFGKRFLKERGVKILMEEYYKNGTDAYLTEQEILQTFNHLRTINKNWPEEKGGRTEFFEEDVLNLLCEIHPLNK